MNLEDVIDPEYGLQQDKWSLTKPRFGKDGQLEVIGWSGKSGSTKKYVLKCHKCGEDSELHGSGHFLSMKGSLSKGLIPCGCGNWKTRTKKDYMILCKRKSEQMGYSFVTIKEPFKGYESGIVMTCPKHGDWDTNTIKNLLNCDNGCPTCAYENSHMPDEYMVARFMATGSYVEGTTFERIPGKKDKSGRNCFWKVYCPACDSTVKARLSNLGIGQNPCLCSQSKQVYAYINILEESSNPIAVKFGVANSAHRRLKAQQNKANCDIRQYGVWKFPNKESCYDAESECKETLTCFIVPKDVMPDGYTETTYIHNIENIISIYEKHGATRIQ